MKLLSPKERRDEQGIEQARQIMRAKELTQILKDLNIKTAQAEAEFMQALAGQRARWQREEEEHTLHMKQLEERIAQLKRLSS